MSGNVHQKLLSATNLIRSAGLDTLSRLFAISVPKSTAGGMTSTIIPPMMNAS